jgi:glutamyl-Q tRNA(Asp) synthetase
MVITRFAPSPTGYLHLGHAYSALLNERYAREHEGTFLVRIEDIDPVRCKDEYTDAILEDLEWLGLRWDGEIVRQSQRMEHYARALEVLRIKGLVYLDPRTRREIREGAPPPDRSRSDTLVTSKVPAAWRLDSSAALRAAGNLSWMEGESERVQADIAAHGDVILARKDTPTSYHLSVTVDDAAQKTSYHLSVTVDDAAQKVTHVIRGRDLFDSTPVHRLLQQLIGLPEPVYRHHELLQDSATGRRFAKSDASKSLRSYRADGVSPEEILEQLGLPT